MCRGVRACSPDGAAGPIRRRCPRECGAQPRRHADLYLGFPARLRQLGEVSSGVRRGGFPDPAGRLQHDRSGTAFHGCALSAQAQVRHLPGGGGGRDRSGRDLIGPLVKRAAMWALGLAYVVAWAIAGWLWNGPPSDLDNFFLPAVRIALSGHPLLIYTVRFQDIIANDNGPLGLVPLTAVAAVLSWLGWLDDQRLRRLVVMGAFLIFLLLIAREAVAAVDRLRGARLAGLARLLAYGVFAASPTLVNGVLGYGHIEQPMTLWLVLLGVRILAAGRASVAGVFFGLAMLTRSLAALPTIPLGLLLLARGRWRAVVALGGSAAITIALGLLPFLLADRSDAIYSLLTHRAQMPVGGGSLWQVVVGTAFQWVPQRWDVLFVLGLAVLLSLIVILGRRDLEPSSRDTYGLLAMTALTLPLLAKSVWPYYFLDAYVFGAIWWLGQAEPLALRRRLVGVTVPLVAVLGTLLTEYEMPASGVHKRLLEGVTMGAILSALLVALTFRFRRTHA